MKSSEKITHNSGNTTQVNHDCDNITQNNTLIFANQIIDNINDQKDIPEAIDKVTEQLKQLNAGLNRCRNNKYIYIFFMVILVLLTVHFFTSHSFILATIGTGLVISLLFKVKPSFMNEYFIEMHLESTRSVLLILQQQNISYNLLQNK